MQTNKSTSTINGEESVDDEMDESVFERICDTIFVLIPEVPRLKQLFLNWCQLGRDERTQLNSKVATWCCPNRRRLYKPLHEALIRWETVQDTQGAPGCEPGMVSFSCDPQLEEELVCVIRSLEALLIKNRRIRDIDIVDAEIGRSLEGPIEMSLKSNSENNLRCVVSPMNRTPHSVHSCGYITDFKRSRDDEFSAI